jgi:hypothetical protein
VKVDDAVERFGTLAVHPLAQGAEIVAKVNVTRRLHAGENSHRSMVEEAQWAVPE